jgi:hypothetical protein
MRGTFWMFFFGITLGILTMSCGPESDAKAGDVGPLQLEEKIGLGNVRGRLDHMATATGYSWSSWATIASESLIFGFVASCVASSG